MSTQEQDGLLRDLFSLVWPSSHGQTQEVKAELQKRVDSVVSTGPPPIFHLSFSSSSFSWVERSSLVEYS
jgi:hypothetical protein